MHRIQRGPIRGVSLKLWKEERERCTDFISEKSAPEFGEICFDKEAMEMLAELGMPDLPGIEH